MKNIVKKCNSNFVGNMVHKIGLLLYILMYKKIWIVLYHALAVASVMNNLSIWYSIPFQIAIKYVF